MNRNKEIGKVLFQFEKTALLIITMILFINLSVNLLVFLLDNTMKFNFFIEQTVYNLFLFSFVYILIYGIYQVITGIPFLVSLNFPSSGFTMIKGILLRNI